MGQKEVIGNITIYLKPKKKTNKNRNVLLKSIKEHTYGSGYKKHIKVVFFVVLL